MYFKNIPDISYLIEGIKNDSEYFNFNISIPDIYRGIGPERRLINEDLQYQYYNVLDSERPEVVSHRLYGDVQYYWTFFVINEHLRLGPQLQWPLSQKQLTAKIEEDYGDAKTLFTTDRDLVTKPFVIGETISGLTSGASGTLFAIRPDYGQVIVNGDITGNFSATETIKGAHVNAWVTLYRTVNFADAPLYYVHSSTGELVYNHEFFFHAL